MTDESFFNKIGKYLSKATKSEQELKEELKEELLIIGRKIVDVLNPGEHEKYKRDFIESNLGNMKPIDTTDKVAELLNNSDLIKQWNDKLEQFKSIVPKNSLNHGGGGFTATSERVMINGKQNRIVYKKNGKGVGYVKMNGEFVKMKKKLHTK